MRIVLLVLAALGFGLASCSSFDEGSAPRFETLFTIRSGGLDTLYLYPLSFGERVAIRFYETDDSQLGFCFAVDGADACGTIERSPSPIYIAEFRPQCQEETVALWLTLIDASDEPIEIFYVDGAVTQNRAEAENWVSEDPGCELVQSIQESIE